MRFQYPYFLYLFLLVFYLIYKFFIKKDNNLSSINYSNLNLIKSSFGNKLFTIFSRNNVLNFLNVLFLSLAILALSRPQYGNKMQELLSSGYDIMICLDTSTSMLAEDFQPGNRFTVARDVTKNFIEKRTFDRIGLVVFAGVAFAECPLTNDHTALLNLLEKTEIGSVSIDGTAIGNAIVVASGRLKNIKSKERIIILITDGRSNMGEIDPITASNLAKEVGVKIYTIGVGKKGEAPYPVNDPIFGKRYVTIKEDLDEPTLLKIAKNTNGEYFRATDENSLKNICNMIDKLEKTEVKVQEYMDYKEFFLYFLIPSFFVFLIKILIEYFFWLKLP